MADPRPFQSATVEAALRAFNRKQGRFLVADEVGLGKTVVAQQIILKMIEEKRGELVVFYVCNNLSIAAQNRRKLLEILPEEERASAHCSVDRLTLVPVTAPPTHRKLHLYTLTPETSIPIRKGRRRDGRQEERALIHCLVKRLWRDLLRGRRRNLFQRGAKTYWSSVVKAQRKRVQDNPALLRAFNVSVRTEFGIERGQHLPLRLEAINEPLELIAHMRNALAACAIEGLSPDLIIFDEFQNFRDLLSSDIEDAARRVIERLRGEGYSEKTALLMLSATPYELYTRNRDVSDGEPHHSQFFKLVEFLYGGGAVAKTKCSRCQDLFAELQTSIRRKDLNVATTADLRTQIQDILQPIMSRTERASHEDGWSEHSISHKSAPLSESDIRVYCHLAESLIGCHAGSAVPYWTSIPLPAQTMGSRYKAWMEAKKDTDKTELPQLTKEMRDAFICLDEIPHPKIRALLDLLGSEILLLPWLQPSLPWWPLKGSWCRSADQQSKILIFSRFRAVPQAIASLVSYMAESRLFFKKGIPYEDLINKRLLQPGPGRHALLGYFHPSPWLISKTDPLKARERIPSRIHRTIRSQLFGALKELGIEVNPRLRRHHSMWTLIAQIENKAGLWKGVKRAWSQIHDEIRRGTEDQGLGKLLNDWDEQALMEITEISGRELSTLTEYAFCAPGVVIGRALRRHWPGSADCDNLYHTIMASWQGLRNYLDNPIFATEMGGGEESYPKAILEAVRDGNLEAVLDEQIWLLRTLYSLSGHELAKALQDGLQLRSGIFRLHELTGSWRRTFSLRCHVAMPFTGVHAATVEGMETTDKPLRTDEIRRAFNAPFWPYVLATTSVGQEGLDFHTWCSNLVHWDLSHNPVDLEQREGRIQRFGGHSIRKQIAGQLGADVWTQATHGESPWQRLSELAEQRMSDESGLCPWWVCKGAEVKRYVFDVPSSEQRYWLELMKEQRMLYRLVLGQPDQEDLLHLLSSVAIERTNLRDITLELSAYFSEKRTKSK